MAGGVHWGSRERGPRAKTWDLMGLRAREVIQGSRGAEVGLGTPEGGRERGKGIVRGLKKLSGQHRGSYGLSAPSKETKSLKD